MSRRRAPGDEAAAGRERVASGRERREAAESIQRCFRRAKARREGRTLRELWPSITTLKSLYLDADALDAGAEANPLYTDENIVKRNALRADPRVVGALRAAWARLAVVRGGADGEVVGRAEYVSMIRKVYLFLKAEEVLKVFLLEQ